MNQNTQNQNVIAPPPANPNLLAAPPPPVNNPPNPAQPLLVVSSPTPANLPPNAVNQTQQPNPKGREVFAKYFFVNSVAASVLGILTLVFGFGARAHLMLLDPTLCGSFKTNTVLLTLPAYIHLLALVPFVAFYIYFTRYFTGSQYTYGDRQDIATQKVCPILAIYSTLASIACAVALSFLVQIPDACITTKDYNLLLVLDILTFIYMIHIFTTWWLMWYQQIDVDTKWWCMEFRFLFTFPSIILTPVIIVFALLHAATCRKLN